MENFKILNPGGNKTALVIGNKYTDKQKSQINAKILKQNLDVEQVGFIDTKENKLEMAGGEFCINATRCAIWNYLNGQEGKIKLEVSGYKSKIIGGITKAKDVYVNMKINKKMDNILHIKGIFNLVNLDGILLAVVNENDSINFIKNLRKNENKSKGELKELMKTFVTEEKAVGIILLENENGKIKINPIIWVKTVDTLYYETACGSGSLATAIYKKYAEGIEKIDILQPSGYSININLKMQNDYIKEAVVQGKVLEEE